MKRVVLSTLIPLVFAAACSSDNQSFSNTEINPPAPPPPPAGFDIDSNNAVAVTQVAYGAVLLSGDLAGLAGSTGLTGNANGGMAKPSFEHQLGNAFDRLMQKVPLGPDVQDCIVNGTVTVSGDIVDPLVLATGMLSVGDTFLVEYTGCDDGVGEIIDGEISMVVEAFSGDVLTGAYNMTMAMTMTDFQVTTPADVLTSNGDATAALNTTLAPYVEAAVSGASMRTDTNTSSDTLLSYSSAQTLDAGETPSPYTMTAAGGLDSTQLGGVISYSTPVTFQGIDSNYPHTGELLVSAANSSARLVVENDVDVRIEIDADGDGTVDDTIVTTWAELAGT